MPVVLTVANQKGGCGKTTTVMNLAGGLTEAGYRVLVADADPQASATRWSLESSQDALPFDVSTVRQLGGSFSRLLKVRYDVVLIDTPAGLAEGRDEAALFARQAVAGSDAVLMPLRPSSLDFTAARTFVRYLEKVKRPGARVAVLLNAMEHTSIGREARSVAEQLVAPIPGAVVLENTIGRRAAITEVSGSGKTIFTFQRRHVAALEYANLTKEIIKWLQPNAPLLHSA